MGGACCVASKDKTPSNRTSEMNLRHSSSQSFRCVSRDEMNNHVGNHHQRLNQSTPNVMMEIKRSFDAETEILSDGGSHRGFQTSIWQKSPASEETEVDDDRSSVSVLTVKGGCSHQVEASLEKSTITENSETNHFTTLSSVKGHAPPTDLTPSRQVRRSHRFLRQISGKVPLSKSSNGSGLSEERRPFVLSLCSSSDLAQGSHGESSDDWSMRAFSELVASSQKEGLSFDSDFVGSFQSQLSSSPSSTHLLSCGICLRLLSERSSWLSNEFSTTAVLTCGHVFHAVCLEKITSEAEKFDPSCPVCTVGSSLKLSVLKYFRSESEPKGRNKISRIGIMDSELEGTSSSRQSTSCESKGSKLGISSGMKNSLSKPFLRRYFSLGSKQSRATRKTGFGERQ